MAKPSRYWAFAVLDRRGHLLWGAIKRSEIEAQEARDRYNPDPTGEGMGESIVNLDNQAHQTEMTIAMTEKT